MNTRIATTAHQCSGKVDASWFVRLSPGHPLMDSLSSAPPPSLLCERTNKSVLDVPSRKQPYYCSAHARVTANERCSSKLLHMTRKLSQRFH